MFGERWVLLNEVESPEDGGAAVAEVEAPSDPFSSEESLRAAVEEAVAEFHGEEPKTAEATEKPRDDKGRFASEEKEATAEQETEEPQLDADLDGLAKRYGLSKEEVSGYQSADELQRALDFADRELVKRLKPAPLTEEPKTDPKQEEQPKTEPAKPAPEVAPLIERLKEEGVDDSLVAVVEAMAAQQAALQQKYDSELQKNSKLLDEHSQFRDTLIREQQQAQERIAREEGMRFLGHLDSLGLTELFGEPNKAADDIQKANISEARATLNVLIQHGRVHGMSEAEAVERAVRIAFPGRIEHREKAAQSKALQKQSRQVMGTGQRSTRRPDVPFDGPDEEHPIYNEFEQAIKDGTWKPGLFRKH